MPDTASPPEAGGDRKVFLKKPLKQKRSTEKPVLKPGNLAKKNTLWVEAETCHFVTYISILLMPNCKIEITSR